MHASNGVTRLWGFWMQVLKCAGCAGVATGSILVYAYILMYYTKNRGFRGGGYLKAEGERVRL